MNNQSQVLSTPHFKSAAVQYSHSFLEIQIKNKFMTGIQGRLFQIRGIQNCLLLFFYTDVKLTAHFLTKKKVLIYIFCYLPPTFVFTIQKYLKVISNIKKCLSTSVLVMCSCQPLPQLLQQLNNLLRNYKACDCAQKSFFHHCVGLRAAIS